MNRLDVGPDTFAEVSATAEFVQLRQALERSLLLRRVREVPDQRAHLPVADGWYSGTVPVGGRLPLMKEITFEPPVGIYFGRMGQMRAVGTAREAAECLMSERWPSHSGQAFEYALLTLIAVSEGRKDAAQAREAFAQAAKEAGILTERRLMMH